MRRIFSVLAVTALMVTMLVASALPAFAAASPTGEIHRLYTCAGGQQTAYTSAQAGSQKAYDKHSPKAFACAAGGHPGEGL